MHRRTLTAASRRISKIVRDDSAEPTYIPLGEKAKIDESSSRPTSSRTMRKCLKPFCTHTKWVEISPRLLEGTFGEFQNFRYGTGYWATTPLTCPPNGCSARHGYHGCSLPRRRCCSAEQLERPVNIFLLYSTHISSLILIATLQAPQALSAGGVEGHAKRGVLRGSVQGIYPLLRSVRYSDSDP